MGRKRQETCILQSNNQWKPRQISSWRSMCTSEMLQKNWSECRKSCAYNENGPKQTFSRKRTCIPFSPRDITLVLLCIKLWLVRGGETVRETECIILASVWARNSRFQRHLNGPQKARNVYPTVQKSIKTMSNVILKETVHIWGVGKNWPECWKSCANPRKCPKTDVFAKTDLQTLLAWRHDPGAVMH
jgi:hypothetical protein